MMKDGTDYCLPGVVLFNPNYSLKDWFMYFRRDSRANLDFYLSDEFQAFSLKGETTYPLPYVNINGDMDYQANVELAQAYFDAVRAAKGSVFDEEHRPRFIGIEIGRIFQIVVSSA